jgi:hypothetical protein
MQAAMWDPTLLQESGATTRGALASAVVAAAACVAHQLIDHPPGDDGVLQPGGKGVPQVMRTPQVQVAQLGPGYRHRGLVDPLQVVGRQRRPGTPRNAIAATRSRQDEILGTGTAGELAADCLDEEIVAVEGPTAG